MSEYAGWVVRAAAGRDKDGIFCTLGCGPDGLLLLADGKRRRVQAPKRKKLCHVEVLRGGGDPWNHPAIQKLRQGAPVTNRELRRALAAFKEGNYPWLKTI